MRLGLERGLMPENVPQFLRLRRTRATFCNAVQREWMQRDVSLIVRQGEPSKVCTSVELADLDLFLGRCLSTSSQPSHTVYHL